MEKKCPENVTYTGSAHPVKETEAYYAHGGAKSEAGARRLACYLPSRLGDVLDVGCGDGAMLSAIVARANSITAVDTSESAVLIVRKKFADSDVRQADVEIGLPYKSATFDTLLFCDVLEHLRQPVSALEETHRLLRVGGRILVTTPNPNSLFRVLRGDRWFGLSDPGHLLFYTGFSVAHILKKIGFKIERQSVAGLTNTPFDFLLGFTRTGGTIVTLAKKS